MWSQLSEDVQAWDSKPENKDTYAAVLNIIELLQDKADEAHLSAAAKGLLPVLEAAIVADRIPPEHLPAARRALERFQAVQARARQAEGEARSALAAVSLAAGDAALERGQIPLARRRFAEVADQLRELKLDLLPVELARFEAERRAPSPTLSWKAAGKLVDLSAARAGGWVLTSDGAALALWDVVRARQVASWSQPGTEAVAISSDGRYLACGGEWGARLLDRRRGELARPAQPHAALPDLRADLQPRRRDPDRQRAQGAGARGRRRALGGGRRQAAEAPRVARHEAGL